MGKDKRILIFNVNWLGDVLFSTAAIRNIRRNYPKSFIACVIPSRCYPILKGNPYLDEVIIFDEKDRHQGVFPKLSFVKMLREKDFDTAFILHRSLTRALICRLAGIPERIGYDTKKRGFLLTKKIPLPKKDSLHRIDYYLNIIEQAGIKVEDRYLDFYIDEKDKEIVDDLLIKNAVKPGDFLIVCNAGGNWLPKRWPKEYWAYLADKLISELKVKAVFAGAQNDMPLVKDIVNQMKEKPLILCGKMNIKQLGALCKRADVFITADTGPLHIASALGTKKIITIFGPTSPEITGPLPLKNVSILQKDVGCKIPCYEVHCQDNRCMKAVTPDWVLDEVRKTRK